MNILYEEVELTEDCLKRAAKYAEEIRFAKSIRGDGGTESRKPVGAIGETVLIDYLKGKEVEVIDNREGKDATKYDLLVNGKKVEVKTKDRTVAPKSYYECSVPLYNHTHQIPDWFYFISLYREGSKYKKAYILGGITYKELEDEGVVMMDGDVDTRNGWACNESCINITINKLTTNTSMLNLLKL